MSRVALVTGVGGGIGMAIAAAFHTRGWQVVGVDRADVDLPHVDRFARCDISVDGAVASLFDELALDRLDAVINNAAVQVNRALVETTDDDWRLTMDTNLRAAFQMIRGAHHLLQATRGSVVNVSSVHALATSPNVAAYAISKGALVAMTRSAALELAIDGIRCNAVLPGAIDTPMLRDGLGRREHPDGPDGNLAALVDRTPLGFVATPDQLAPTIVFLADSELSPYTTGQSIVVDGGAMVRLGTE